MGQFDVHENKNPETNQIIPYLLDIQSDLLASLTTRVVIPLIHKAAMGKVIKHLNPQFDIGQTTVCMSTSELAGVPVKYLGKKVASLKRPT